MMQTHRDKQMVTQRVISCETCNGSGRIYDSKIFTTKKHVLEIDIQPHDIASGRMTINGKGNVYVGSDGKISRTSVLVSFDIDESIVMGNTKYELVHSLSQAVVKCSVSVDLGMSLLGGKLTLQHLNGKSFNVDVPIGAGMNVEHAKIDGMGFPTSRKDVFGPLVILFNVSHENISEEKKKQIVKILGE